MKAKPKSRAEYWAGIVFKKAFPGQLARTLFSPRPVIIVASNGRSGSTLTYEALRRELKRKYVMRRENFGFVSRLEDAGTTGPAIFKTHDFPDALSKQGKCAKVIFCFGSTKDSAFSVYAALHSKGEDWIRRHFEHLNATGDFEELFQRDILQQVRQLKEWCTYEAVPVLCVHYDAIWDHQEEISNFLGLTFKAPERRERSAKNIPEDIQLAADAVYDPIDRIVDDLPGCFLASEMYREVLDRLPKD